MESLQPSRSRASQAEDPPPSIWDRIIKGKNAFIGILILLKASNIELRSLYKASFMLIVIMKIPKEVLSVLEDFWTAEYESDYLHIKNEKPTRITAKTPLPLITGLVGRH